jgi:hypothetical protein
MLLEGLFLSPLSLGLPEAALPAFTSLLLHHKQGSIRDQPVFTAEFAPTTSDAATGVKFLPDPEVAFSNNV